MLPLPNSSTGFSCHHCSASPHSSLIHLMKRSSSSRHVWAASCDQLGSSSTKNDAQFFSLQADDCGHFILF